MTRQLFLAVSVLVITSTAALAQGFPPTSWEPEAGQMPTPTFVGSSGLVLTPSAVALPPATVQAGYHGFEFDAKDQRAYNANVGVMAGFEVGVARLEDIPQPAPLTGHRNETIFNLKYQLDMPRLLGIQRVLPRVAVGAWDVTDEVNRAWYIVATQDIVPPGAVPPRVSVHLGLGSTKSKGGLLDGLFGGVEVALAKDLLLQAEYDSDNINAAARYFVTDMVALDLGMVDQDLAWGVTLATPF